MAARQDAAQHSLDSVRKPRVHITYDVEVGGAIQKMELPFVAGVLGDFAGMPLDPLPDLRERSFTDISLDNFDSVLKGLKPRTVLSVKNTLSPEPDAPNLKVDLQFQKLDDFSPIGVVSQVRPLAELLELRTKLADLRGSLQGNSKLEEMILTILKDDEKLNRLKAEISESREK